MFNKKESKLWLYALVTMAIIVVVWAVIFYPQSLKQSRARVDNGFSDFRTKMDAAFSLFKKSSPPVSSNQSQDEVRELREKVFGDSIKK